MYEAIAQISDETWSRQQQKWKGKVRCGRDGKDSKALLDITYSQLACVLKKHDGF